MQSSGTEATRVISLDAMRGFAVMGILAMNIVGFSMPEWAYVTPSAYGGETVADQIAWFFSFVFIGFKLCFPTSFCKCSGQWARFFQGEIG